MKYEIGDMIVYSAFGGEKRTIIVDEKEEDIKNGRPGFGGIIISSSEPSDKTGQSVWGYDSQIIEVK